MAEKRIFPSRLWYPQDLAGQAVWWANFATQFALVGLSLGFTAAEISAVQDTATTMQFYATGREGGEAWLKGLRKHINDVRELAVGEPTPAFPANPTLALPEVIPTGINQRLNELENRIIHAPAYTNEIGALLGIIPSSPAPTPESLLKPTIEVFENLGDFTFKADVTRKGQPAFKIQIQRSGETTWTDVAFATSNPVSVTVTPSEPGKPERIFIRAILLKNNQPVGVPSDIVAQTINP
jgi:hypothetical protein